MVTVTKKEAGLWVGKATVTEPSQEVSTPSPQGLWTSVSQLKGQTQTLRDTQEDLRNLELDEMPGTGGRGDSNLGLWPKQKATSTDTSLLQKASSHRDPVETWEVGGGDTVFLYIAQQVPTPKRPLDDQSLKVL